MFDLRVAERDRHALLASGWFIYYTDVQKKAPNSKLVYITKKNNKMIWTLIGLMLFLLLVRSDLKVGTEFLLVMTV